MMPSSSPSNLSLAVFFAALIVSPHSGTSFPLSRIPHHDRSSLTTASSNQYYSYHPTRASSPLYSAIDMPARPMEEEKEKKKRNSNDNISNSDKREWKQVVGGFVPNILKRDTPYPTVQKVDTLEDYKRVVVDEQDAIVVVRFYAPWCKSCKAAHPLFKKMVSEHSSSNVKFVEVPLTKETAYIHEGLGVPSVPFGHVYHPDVGLVEEKKINKKVFKEFRCAVDDYVRGSCDLPVDEEDEEDSEADGGFQ